MISDHEITVILIKGEKIRDKEEHKNVEFFTFFLVCGKFNPIQICLTTKYNKY